MKELSNADAELKKTLLIKKECNFNLSQAFIFNHLFKRSKSSASSGLLGTRSYIFGSMFGVLHFWWYSYEIKIMKTDNYALECKNFWLLQICLQWKALIIYHNFTHFIS